MREIGGVVRLRQGASPDTRFCKSAPEARAKAVVDHSGITSNQLIEELQKLGWIIFYHEQDKRAKEEYHKNSLTFNI